jgi:hypothetical protein
MCVNFAVRVTIWHVLIHRDFNAGIENEPQNWPVSSNVRYDMQVSTAASAVITVTPFSFMGRF